MYESVLCSRRTSSAGWNDRMPVAVCGSCGLRGPESAIQQINVYRLSSELQCHYRVSGSREREIYPLGQVHPSQPPTISSVSPLYFYRLSLPNHDRLQSSRITKPPNGTVPFDSSNSEVMIYFEVLVVVVVYKLSFPTSGCPFPRLFVLPFACHH